MEYIDNPPEYRKNCPVGDWPQLLYFSQIGDIFYIEDEMFCYRRNVSGSVTTTVFVSTVEKKKCYNLGMISMMEKFNKCTDYMYSAYCQSFINRFKTTVALALKYGSRIGVLGITDYAPQAYMRMIPEQMILGRPEGVHSTLDLMTPEGKASVLKLGMKLKEQGAEVIALACTGLATIGIAKDLEKETGLPVIDPVMAEGMFAYFEYLRKK